MSIELNHILISALVSLSSGVLIQWLIIRHAKTLRLFAKPDQRRRHEREVPMTGGIGVLGAWLIGIGTYTWLEPHWLGAHLQSTVVLVTGALILHVLGLWDDLIQLGPYPKLFVQSFVGILLLAFEPNIHALMSHWQETIGFLSWAFGFLWILGITNSINLIDGLDGLAGGMSLLAGVSILTLLWWAGDYAENAAIHVSVLLPAVAAFLIFNWNPAKVFLGDNGSLPIGMILSSASLMGYAQTKSWVMVLSLVLIFGYPILDMAICVLRRYRNRQPIFKGDRAHLHFRISKLGLNVHQTASLLLAIGLYLQISALAVNKMDPAAALLGLTIVFFSIFTLLFLVRSIESWKVNRVFAYVQKQHARGAAAQQRSRWMLTIQLSPMLEKSSTPQETHQLIQALEALLKTLIRDTDRMLLTEKLLIILFENASFDEEQAQQVKARFEEKISEFLKLFNVECATSTLPLELKQQSLTQEPYSWKATGT